MALLLGLLAGFQPAHAQSPGGVPANLELWLRADAGVTGTTDVSQWDDQSGNANNAAQATGTRQPALTADAATSRLLCLGLGAGLLAALGWLATTPAPRNRPDAPRPAPALALLAVWWIFLLPLTGLSGESASWYALPFLPVYALALGGLAAAGVALRLRRCSLIPIRDPRLHESLAFENI